MGGLFHIESKFYQTMEKVANCLILNILWMIFSLPIVTIGASTTALYETVRRVVRQNTGKLWPTFWNAFKSNFKQSTVLWLIFLGAEGFLLADCYCAYILSDTNSMLGWLTGILLILVAFVIMWQLYWYPYIAHIDDPIKAVLKNTLIICLGNFGKSLLLLAAFAFCVIILVFLPYSPVFLLFLPAAHMYIADILLTNIFGQYWSTDSNTEV